MLAESAWAGRRNVVIDRLQERPPRGHPCGLFNILAYRPAFADVLIWLQVQWYLLLEYTFAI